MSGGRRNALKCFGSPAVLVVTLAAVFVFALPLGAGQALARPGHHRCADADRAPRDATLHFLRSSMLCLVNRVREHYGLASLRYSADLRRSATGHSNDMVASHYFSHDGANGSTPSGRIARTGYLDHAGSYFIGENIGGGESRGLGSALSTFRAWMHSPPHRANILDREFHDFGAGVARGFPYGGGSNAATYTLDFGMRR